MVKLVVGPDADPFVRDASGKYAWSCLFPPIPADSYDILKYFLDLGMPVNEKLSNDVLPFGEWFTSEALTPQMVELFLDHGLDLTLKTKGKSLLDIARACARADVKQVLIRRGLLENKA
jgi:hypothetical protein